MRNLAAVCVVALALACGIAAHTDPVLREQPNSSLPYTSCLRYCRQQQAGQEQGRSRRATAPPNHPCLPSPALLQSRSCRS